MKSFLKKSALCSASCLQALSVTGMAVGAIALAAPAAAQDYTRGVLAGTVVDEAGAPVAGAEVTVRSNEQGFSQTTTTNAAGGFTVSGLPTGTYTVVVSSGGTPIVEDRGATVLAGQNNSYRYIAGGAEAVAAEEGIVVLGQRIRVNDFAATETGVTLDVQDLAETVPVSRDQTSLILLAPGTTAGDAGFGNLASIGGATVAENAYYVNGLNITNFRNGLGGATIPFEFYRTLEVKTGGYQAEYGRALGGVTSAVTKAGTNEFKAGVVATWTPDALNSHSSPDTTIYDRFAAQDYILAKNDQDYRESWDASLYVSGPIIKDRLFFYALYQPQHQKTEDLSPSGYRNVISESDTPFFGGKVDFVIADGHRLEATYFRDRQDFETSFVVDDFDGTYVPNALTAGGIYNNIYTETGGDNFIGTYTGQFTDFLTLSLAYGENHQRNFQYADPNISSAISRVSGPLRNVYGSFAGDLRDQDERKFYRADVDVYADFFGEHHIKVGFDYEQLTASERTSYTGGGRRYDIRSNASLAYYYFNEGEFKTNQRAFYIQDSWSLMDGRLNLQLGLRNDRFRNYTQNGDLYYNSGSQWGPRLGATFDVFGDGATKINAFWGRYFLPIATNTNIRLAGSEIYYLQYDNYGTARGTDANGDGIPDLYTLGPDGEITNFGTAVPGVNTLVDGGNPCPAGTPDAGERCYAIYGDGTLGAVDTLVSANLNPSYTDEWILGLSHRMGDWTFGVNYINRRLGETLEDVAVDAAVLAYCDANGIAGCASEFTGFHQYVLANPGKDITVRLDGDCSIAGQCDVVTLLAEDLGYPQAVRNYDAVSFEIDKAFNGLYGFNFNYTWTNLEGNFEGGVKSDNNQTDTGLTQDFDQPGLVEGAYGDLANGREHAFKFYGHVQPIEFLDIGVNAVLESPRKFSCIGNYYDSSNFAASYGAASYYCQQPDVGGTPVDNTWGGTSYLVPRGTAFESDWNKRIDLGVKFDLGVLGLASSYARVDVFNVFDWNSKLDFAELGDISFGDVDQNYGRVRNFQAPRSVRLTLALRYGGE